MTWLPLTEDSPYFGREVVLWYDFAPPIGDCRYWYLRAIPQEYDPVHKQYRLVCTQLIPTVSSRLNYPFDYRMIATESVLSATTLDNT